MVARELAPVVLSCMPGLASAARRRERAGAGAPPA
jgi:hypothetical protein